MNEQQIVPRWTKNIGNLMFSISSVASMYSSGSHEKRLAELGIIAIRKELDDLVAEATKEFADLYRKAHSPC